MYFSDSKVHVLKLDNITSYYYEQRITKLKLTKNSIGKNNRCFKILNLALVFLFERLHCKN